MSLWLLLPVKPFAEAKSRLAGVLTAPARAQLMRSLFEHTLAVAHRTDLFAGIVVVSRDASVRAAVYAAANSPTNAASDSPILWVDETGGWAEEKELEEKGPEEIEAEGKEAVLNAALEQARAAAHAHGATAVLALPADLPLLTPDDLLALQAKAVASAVPGRAAVVISPSRDGGTNALYVDRAVPLPFRFGPHSFARHAAAARALGATVTVHHSPTLAFDLDSPEDLAKWQLRTQDCPQPG